MSRAEDVGDGSPPSIRGGSARVRSACIGLACAALLAVHAGLAVHSLWIKSPVFDETTHLPAGLAHARTGEMRLNRQHPPLVKLLAGFAADTLDPFLPLDHANYLEGREWDFGRRVLFSAGNDPMELFRRGRLPVVGLSVLGGLAVFLWSRRRWGDLAGLAGLTLYAFSPTVLAHARLVTMDAAVAAGAVWTLYLWWRATRGRGGPSIELACGVALGLALASKFSGLLLLPTMALCDLWANGLRARSLEGGWRRRLRAWTLVGAAATTVLAFAYLDPTGPLRYIEDLGRLYGDRNPDYRYYLHGDFSSDGWPHYFLVALGIKTTLPALAAMLGGLALAATRRERWRDDLYLWLPAALWLGVTSWGASNWGVRYVQPLYPWLFVLAGRLVPLLRRTAPTVRVLAALLLVAHGMEAIRRHPDYIPYFNQIVGDNRIHDGKPQGGIHWLDGSNLDWGQDLYRLPGWLADRGIARARTLYYGTGSPTAFGVPIDPDLRAEDWTREPRPGIYVISAQYLIRGLSQAEIHDTGTDWLRRYEPIDSLGGTLYLYVFPPVGKNVPPISKSAAESQP